MSLFAASVLSSACVCDYYSVALKLLVSSDMLASFLLFSGSLVLCARCGSFSGPLEGCSLYQMSSGAWQSGIHCVYTVCCGGAMAEWYTLCVVEGQWEIKATAALSLSTPGCFHRVMRREGVKTSPSFLPFSPQHSSLHSLVPPMNFPTGS